MVLGATPKSANSGSPAAYHSAFHELRFDAGRPCLDLVATAKASGVDPEAALRAAATRLVDAAQANEQPRT